MIWIKIVILSCILILLKRENDCAPLYTELEGDHGVATASGGKE